MNGETKATCELCGEPMPPGETMFKIHGYSGPCPKEPLPREVDNKALAESSAVAALGVLETPIRGVPTIRVNDRDKAIRLLSSAFLTIWEAKESEARP